MTSTVKSRPNWLSPTNKLRWMKAFKSKAKFVVLTDGRKFTIEYKTMSSKLFGDKWDVAEVAGPDVQDPSGYFRMDTVTRDEWLYKDDFKNTTDSMYVGCLESFLKSEDMGVDVRVEWPDLKDRSKEALRRGFNNAVSSLGSKATEVKVMSDSDGVFLLKVVKSND